MEILYREKAFHAWKNYFAPSEKNSCYGTFFNKAHPCAKVVNGRYGNSDR